MKYTIFIILLTIIALHGKAARLHCSEDSLKVVSLLEKVKNVDEPYNVRIKKAAQVMVGIPYGPSADNDSLGTIMVNLHSLDKLGFLNYAMAIAKATEKTEPTYKDFEEYLEILSRKQGEDTGFASRLFYCSDWIVDNVYRGNLKEMTEYVTGGGFRTKTLDYISRHPDEFPAMKDSATIDKIKMVEMGYRSHRIPHLKKQSASNKSLHELMKDGDIIVMLSPEEDYDIYDVGIVDMKDGVPYLIHIPTGEGVKEDDYPLARLFKLENQHFYGYRWLRPTE